MSWTDKKIDKLYRQRANDLAFDYKNEYWVEMDAKISDANVISSEVFTDDQMDQMFQTKAANMSFAYKPEYWDEMAAMLPNRKKRDFLWFFTSLIFIGFLGITTFVSNTESQPGSEPLITQNESNNNKANPITSNSIEQNETDPEIDHPFVLEWDPSTLDLNSLFQPDTYYGDIGYYSQSELFNQNYLMVDPSTMLGADEKGTIDDLALLPLDEEDRSLAAYPNYNAPVRSKVTGYLQAVGGLSQSLITPSKELSYSYGIGAGIEIENRNLTIAIGANGFVSNHNDLVLNRVAKVYGFGSESYQFRLDYQQLYAVEGNFEVAYAFNRHRVKVGVRPSYVFSSRVRYDNVQVDESNSLSDVNGESRSIYGYMDGVSRFGIKPHVGYAFRITPTMEVGLNVGVQLMPMVNEDFIDGINNTLPIDGQIYFRKSLRFKK